jgi:hypothetical protein
MDVIPLPATSDGAPAATCEGCGAPLAADQRYCLACGRPCSPVRLAFLDVLQTERQPAGAGGPNLFAGAPQPAGYASMSEPAGLLASLRRYSGLFGLLGVLLASLLIGLLVGHWLTGSPGSAGKQVLEVKGLSGALAAAPAAPSSGAGTSTGPANGGGSPSSSSTGHGASTGSSPSQAQHSPKSEKAEEAEEAKEIKTTTKPLAAAHKTSAATLQKLEHTTGKQHAKEVAAALGNGPIETGH